MIVELDRDSGIPLYLQIAGQVRDMISSGALKVGDRLSPNRELAKSLGVNRTTVTTAYAELEADGLISSHIGRGTFVAAVPTPRRTAPAPTERPQPAPMLWSALLAEQRSDSWLDGLLLSQPGKGVISLAPGLPSADLFPLDDFRRSVDRVLRKEGRVLLQLGTSSGYRPLQEYIASQMALSGVSLTPEEVIITNGCQQSLDLIRRVFVGASDEIAIENPTYPGAISVFCAAGAKYVTVPTGEKGLDLDVLEEILSQRRPKLLYTIPTYHNPTGVSLDMAGRRRLLDLAIKHRVPIVEDEIYRDLHYDGPVLPSLKALDRYGVVISINSFSKVGFPGLRVGWIAAPPAVIDHLNVAKQHCDLHASLLTQAAIFEFSRHGLLAKHIRRVKKAYAARRDVMLEALDRYFPKEAKWNKPAGGMAIWIELPQGLNASEILLLAAQNGVTFSPGEHFYSTAPPRNMMRLCFTVAGPADIEEGVKRLGAVIKARMLAMKKQRTVRKGEGLRALV
jgi:GntR family transcriptional regulator/MocR family aminotransferase